MAIGPFARILAQVLVPVVAVLARAIPAAYGQALNNARKAGVDATEAAAPVFGKRISRSEALQVLNITEQEIKADPKIVQKVSRVERNETKRNGTERNGTEFCSAVRPVDRAVHRALCSVCDRESEKRKQSGRNPLAGSDRVG